MDQNKKSLDFLNTKDSAFPLSNKFEVVLVANARAKELQRMHAPQEEVEIGSGKPNSLEKQTRPKYFKEEVPDKNNSDYSSYTYRALEEFKQSKIKAKILEKKKDLPEDGPEW